MYVYTYICIYMCVCLHVCIHICTCVYMSVRIKEIFFNAQSVINTNYKPVIIHQCGPEKNINKEINGIKLTIIKPKEKGNATQKGKRMITVFRQLFNYQENIKIKYVLPMCTQK